MILGEEPQLPKQGTWVHLPAQSAPQHPSQDRDPDAANPAVLMRPAKEPIDEDSGHHFWGIWGPACENITERMDLIAGRSIPGKHLLFFLPLLMIRKISCQMNCQPADLMLSFAEHKGAAELLPEIARKTGASAVLVAVDDESWLPRGLDRQLHGWLDAMNVACATPKPLCSLTENTMGSPAMRWLEYHSPLIAEFASYFGKPELELEIDPDSATITAADGKKGCRLRMCPFCRRGADRIISK